MKGRDTTIKLLLEILERGYRKRAWHGPNLKQSLKGVSTKAASWRPAPGRHNVWEVAVHAAYWKYAVRRRILGEPRGSFGLKGSNWFHRPAANPGISEKAWRNDRALLEEEHRKLCHTVSELRRPSPRAVWMIYGAAFHDVYHAGQVRLLLRLLRRA